MKLEILGIDPRCLSTKRLKAPTPLPHVSRRKLKLVKDRLHAPLICHCCNQYGVKLVNNSEVYNGRSFGKWPYVYLCPHCRAYVGLHPDTDLPLGTMADSFTRDARKHAKAPFSTLVRVRFNRDRDKAYTWLADSLNIPRRECHFAMMDEERAMEVAGFCYEQLLEGE